MKNMPAYIVEIDQALSEDMSKAIRLIIEQVDKERTRIITDRIDDLLRTRQYTGANTDYLNGIRETLEVIKGE